MPTTAELLAALPAEDPQCEQISGEIAASQIPAKDLARLFQALSDRPIPTSSMRRFASLGGLSAKLTMAYLAYWIRSWYKPTEASEKDLLETHLRSALTTLETMGYLRGAVSKVGQLLAVLPEFVPEGYIDTLNSLHFQAPPMHFALVREQLLSELGDPQEIFAEFDETAIAAASIGQVHRARLKTGEQVAVKIQYPGIARSIRADLRNLKATMRPFLFMRDWKAVESIFEEIRVGLEQETDYENEANNIREIRRLFVDDEHIVVPRVFDEFSTRRVLTMEYLEGQTLEEFLETSPSQETRDHYGRCILESTYLPFANRMLYNDVHPGNFIFMSDNRLGFIDFGNVRHYTDEEWKFHKELAIARNGTHEDHVAICKRSLMMSDADAKKHSRMLELVIEGFSIYNEPILHEGPFDYGDASYMRRMAEWITETAKQNWLRQMPMNTYSHRLSFQLPTLLFQLKSRVDVAELMDELGRVA